MNTQLIQDVCEFVRTTPVNAIPEDSPYCPDMAGTPVMGEPAFAFGDAADPLFKELQRPEAVGPAFRLPQDWLPGAQRVISLFLPYSQAIRDDNRDTSDTPRGSILHARIEGQATVFESCRFIVRWLEERGYHAVVPSLTEELETWTIKRDAGGQVDLRESFRSNWSERHVAYVCDLGTFSLTRGIITEKGLAGRVGTIVTDAPFSVTPRKYSGITDYCIMCGECVKRCPAHAISLETGKQQIPCWEYLEWTKRASVQPYFGCGKCQINVPCETGIPKKNL